MSDTPRTDAIDAIGAEVHAAYFMMRNHAWGLERELAAHSEQWRVSSVCREMAEQRDKLASAVRLLMDVIGPADDPTWADDDQVEAAWQAGLAALKGVES